MFSRPLSISLSIHLFFISIIVIGLPSFDKFDELPTSVIEIELIVNELSKEIQEQDDNNVESTQDLKKYSATPNIKPSDRSDSTNNMKIDAQIETESTILSDEEPEEEISEVFATPSAKPELSKLNDKLLTNLEYDEKKEESKEVTALLDKFPDDRNVGDVIENVPEKKEIAKKTDTISSGDILNMKRQIEMCWNPPIGVRGAENQRVQVQISLAKDGSILNVEPITRSTNDVSKIAIEAAVRAVKQCEPYKLPIDKYDLWKEIKFTFDPRNMMGG